MWPRKRYRSGYNPETGANANNRDNLLDLEDLWDNAALYAADRLPEPYGQAGSSSRNKRSMLPLGTFRTSSEH